MASLENHCGGNGGQGYYRPHSEESHPKAAGFLSGAATAVATLLPLSLLFSLDGGAIVALLILAIELIGVLWGVTSFNKPPEPMESPIPKFVIAGESDQIEFEEAA